MEFLHRVVRHQEEKRCEGARLRRDTSDALRLLLGVACAGLVLNEVGIVLHFFYLLVR